MRRVMFKYGSPPWGEEKIMEYDDDATDEDIEIYFKEWLFEQVNPAWWAIEDIRSRVEE